jgi:ATP synthase protein I
LKGHQDPWQEDSEEDFVTLDAAQARALRELQPGMSARQVVALQALCGLVFAAIAGWVSSRGWSVAYGAFAVVLPNALLARGMSRKPTSINALRGVTALLVWEMVKVGLTLAMLLGAPWVVKNLSWPALLAGLVLTMKVHWLTLAYKPKPTVLNQV